MQRKLLEKPDQRDVKESREFDVRNIQSCITLHKATKIPFAASLTNYTTTISSALVNILYQKEHRSVSMFIAYQKILKDLEGKSPPSIDPDELKYFINGFNGSNIYADKIYNIDLKAAYATILFNKGILSKTTLNYLLTLPKMERLVSVGMLASHKETFYFDNNSKIIDTIEQTNPLSGFFFMAIKETHKIMNDIRVILGNDFLFSWVDGVYFANRRHKTSVMNYLKARGMKATFSVLKDFEIEIRKDFHRLKYTKDGGQKLFSIPMQNGYLTRNQIKHFLKN